MVVGAVSRERLKGVEGFGEGIVVGKRVSMLGTGGKGASCMEIWGGEGSIWTRI